MKNSFHGSKAEMDALDTYLKLVRSSEKVFSETHRHLVDHKLTASQFAVLEVLYHLGPLCQREIARKVLKSHGNITTVVQNLERRKLLIRRKNEADRRFFTVELTKTGDELISAMFLKHVTEVKRSLSVLTPAEQHELARLCRKLGLAQKNFSL